MQIRLFRRTRHGVELTVAGRDYANLVAARLGALELDTLDAMAYQSGMALNLATMTTFATTWLIPRLGSLKALFPEMVIHMDAFSKPFLFSQTRFDAALFCGEPEVMDTWSGVTTTLLMEEKVVPVCSLDYMAEIRERIGNRRKKMLEPADLIGSNLLQITSRPDGWRRWFVAQGTIPPAQPFSTRGPRYESFAMIVASAIHNLGVALVPELLVAEELQEGKLIKACKAKRWGYRNYYLVVPEQHQKSKILQRFQQWLQDELKAYSEQK